MGSHVGTLAQIPEPPVFLMFVLADVKWNFQMSFKV